ncbi:MAG: hypothetical protein CME21_22630 [Gemmatimonadetes bacterium]|nr:hypothetical protein [Gemmatimonadota bacterium]MBE85364.1 hypothetical protein [Gemmatimonadota bacterium]HCK09979.1 hypothetical protein [Candidatus Latescibacterota bacterium]
MAVNSPLADLEAKDRKRFYSITLGFMLVAATALIGRTIGDALFLEAFSADDLAYMYPATAATVCAVAYGYARLASRLPLARLVSILSLLLALASVCLRFALMVPDTNIPRIAAYVLGDLVVNLPMLLFWSFAAHCFVPGQAKRLFGLVGAGGTTACILAGFIIKPYTVAFGKANLLLLITVLMVCFAALISRTSRRDGIGRQAPNATGNDSSIGSMSSLLGNTQIRAIVALMLASTVALTLVDYQFKAGAKEYTDDLAGFFGLFYGVASAVSLVIQLFIVHRVLQKGGVFAGLAVLPAALVLTSATAWVTQSFDWTVANKFAVQIFAFTIDSAALQMLYLGVARQTRSQARALAEGIGKPVATGVTGLCLILGASTSALYQLAAVATIVSVVWVVLTRINHNAYIKALVDSLGNKRFDASGETSEIQDVALERHIRDSLESASEEEIVYLLGILPTLDQVDWSDKYREMLTKKDPRIKIASLSYLKTHGGDQDLPGIVSLLNHQDAKVREGAIDAIDALGSPEHLAQVESRLEDPAPETRAAAIASLINSEDLDRLLSAGSALRTMLASSSTVDRVAAAHALGRLQRGGLVRPLISLLQDEETVVVQSALEACLQHRDPKLIPAITPLLANPKVAALAGDALAEFGSPSLDHLIPCLEIAEMEGSFEGAQCIPPILSRIGNAAALPSLRKAAQSHDPVLRTSSIKAFAQITVALEQVGDQRDTIHELTIEELKASRTAASRALAVSGQKDTAVLEAALRQVTENHLSNAFTLISVLHPTVRPIEMLQSLSQEGEARNNAIEILENVLKGDLRTETLQTLSDQGTTTSDTNSTLQEILLEDCSNWVRIGALYAIGRTGRSEPNDVTDNLRHRQAVVRETALEALISISPKRARQEAENLSDDDADIVRMVAERISTAG